MAVVEVLDEGQRSRDRGGGPNRRCARVDEGEGCRRREREREKPEGGRSYDIGRDCRAGPTTTGRDHDFDDSDRLATTSKNADDRRTQPGSASLARLETLNTHEEVEQPASRRPSSPRLRASCARAAARARVSPSSLARSCLADCLSSKAARPGCRFKIVLMSIAPVPSTLR